MELIDKEILKPFSSPTSITTDTVTDTLKFEEYCLMCPDGIFLNVFLTKDNADWLKEVTCTLLQCIHSSTNYVNDLRKVCATKVHSLMSREFCILI